MNKCIYRTADQLCVHPKVLQVQGTIGCSEVPTGGRSLVCADRVFPENMNRTDALEFVATTSRRISDRPVDDTRYQYVRDMAILRAAIHILDMTEQHNTEEF